MPENAPPSAAGRYQVKAEISGTSSKYYIGQATTVFTIAQKDVTVRAEDKSVTRGSTLPTPTVSYTGFVGSDGVDNALTTQALARLNVQNSDTTGTSVIDFQTQAALNDTLGKNYTLSHVNGTLNITRNGGGSDGGGSGGGGSTGGTPPQPPQPPKRPPTSR